MKREIKPLLIVLVFFGLLTLLAMKATGQTSASAIPIGYAYAPLEYTYAPGWEIEKLIDQVEDIQEWIESDRQNGYIEDYVAQTYLDNLDDILKTLRQNIVIYDVHNNTIE